MLLLASCGGDQVVPADNDGCGPLTDPIVESNRFTPYEDRHHLAEIAEPTIIAQPGAVGAGALPEELRTVGSTLDGLPVVAAIVNPALDGASVYFLDRALTDGDTHETVLAEGGVYLDQQLIGTPGENLAVIIANELRERAVVLKLGTRNAVLIWADPDRNGVRVHNLIWSDATHNYTLTAVRSPERMVGMGRAVVCGIPELVP